MKKTARNGKLPAFFRVLTLLLTLLVLNVPLTALAQDAPAVIFLVRHAEKGPGSDPPLNPAGQKRAGELVNVLRNASVEQVHSTDYRRTRDTADPIVRHLGIPLNIYDPGSLSELAHSLKGKGGRHLVVGHSNTTPELVQLLGGEPGTEIDDAGEYDRLYVITVDGTTVSTVLLRYGAPFISP